MIELAKTSEVGVLWASRDFLFVCLEMKLGEREREREKWYDPFLILILIFLLSFLPLLSPSVLLPSNASRPTKRALAKGSKETKKGKSCPVP